MNYNFTERVRKVLSMARQEATRLQHDYVGTEHVLLGLIREGEGVAAHVLGNLNVDLDQVNKRVDESVRRGNATIALGELPYTNPAKKVLEFAMAEARQLSHSYVGTEHLLLGLLRERKGIAAQVAQLARGDPRRRSLGDAEGDRVRRGFGERARSRERPGRLGALGSGVVLVARRRQVEDTCARPLLPRPDRACAPGRARPDHRTRRRDRANGRDPLPDARRTTPC